MTQPESRFIGFSRIVVRLPFRVPAPSGTDPRSINSDFRASNPSP